MAQIIKDQPFHEIADLAGVSLLKLIIAVENQAYAPDDVVNELNVVYKNIANFYVNYGVKPSRGPAAILTLTSYSIALSVYDESTNTYEFVNPLEVLSGEFKPEGYVPPVIVVKSVSVFGPTLLGYGETGTYTATFSPGNATVATKVWSVSDATKGSIDQSGKFTPAVSKSGNVSIICTINDVASIYPIFMQEEYVAPIVRVTSVSISGPTSLVYGSTGTYTATYAPTNSVVDSKVWSVSPTSQGSITQAGKFTPAAGKSGSVTIKCTIDGVVKSYPVTMQAEVIVLTGITVTGPSTLDYQGTGTYTATPVPSNADITGLVWSVSSTSKASVNTSGVVTGKSGASGPVNVIATVGSISGSKSLMIDESPVDETPIEYQLGEWSSKSNEWV